MENKAPKLSVREKLGYGIGTASVNLIFNVVSTYLLFFYTNVYGLKPADAATMFLVVRIIDAVASPVYGTWVDKRTTKYGKYKGYLLYLSVPYAILSILCFVTPNTGYVFKLIYAYTTYVGLSLLNTFLSPMGAMPAAMTRHRPNRRTSTGVSVGASTASIPATSSASAVVIADQPRNSCR